MYLGLQAFRETQNFKNDRPTAFAVGLFFSEIRSVIGIFEAVNLESL